jgi:hypothetical protein
MAWLEGVMQTPEEVSVMRQLLESARRQLRIAREPGISSNTVSSYLALGDWHPYESSKRARQLDGHKAGLHQQQLLKNQGAAVSLRTVEQSVQSWSEALWQSRQATVCYEIRQSHLMQALEEAFRIWVGMPEQVLVDNTKALVTLKNPRTRELVINPLLATWASRPRPAGSTVCRPKARTSWAWVT